MVGACDGVDSVDDAFAGVRGEDCIIVKSREAVEQPRVWEGSGEFDFGCDCGTLLVDAAWGKGDTVDVVWAGGSSQGCETCVGDYHLKSVWR